MLEWFEKDNLEKILTIVELIAIFPIFAWIRSMFLHDELDKLMLSKPKQRLDSILEILELLGVLSLLNVSMYFFIQGVVPYVNVNNGNIIYTLTKIFTICFSIIAYFVCLIMYVRSNKGATKGIKIINLSIYGCISTLIAVLVGMIGENFVINCIITVLLVFIIIKTFYTDITKQNNSIYNFIESKMFIIIFCSSYIYTSIFIFIIIHRLEEIRLLIFNLIITFAFAYMLAYLRSLNKSIQYFYCTDDIIELYHIERLNNERNKKVKLYIYFTTNNAYYVCGREKLFERENKRFLLNYEDANKCGGFFTEKIKV